MRLPVQMACLLTIGFCLKKIAILGMQVQIQALTRLPAAIPQILQIEASKPQKNDIGCANCNWTYK